MKKILVILLLVSNFCFGQITITQKYVATGGLGSSYGFTGLSMTANKLYLFITIMSGAGQFGTISGDSATWDNILNIGTSDQRIQIYRAMPTYNITTENSSIGSFAGTCSFSSICGFFIVLLEIDNVQSGNNGANAIRQVVADSATGADPTITMSALSQRNAVLSIFGNNRDPFGGSPESGWNELYDYGYGTTNYGAYIMDKINGTDFTPTVTSTSSIWKGISIELRQSGRRITLID